MKPASVRCLLVTGLAVGLASVTACNIDLCQFIPLPAIRIQVKDSVTSQPRASGALAIATSRCATETLTVWDVEDSLNAVELRTHHLGAGTYTVMIFHTGYQPWVRSGVHVATDSCGVVVTDLVALLQPATTPNHTSP